MIRNRVVKLAAVLAAAVAISVVLWPRSPAESPAPEGTREEAPEGAEFTDARVVGRHRGQRQWVVVTQVLREEGENHIRASRIDSGTLFRDGEPYFDLRALEAWSHRVTNDLVLRGDVVAVHVDGAVFRTDVLEWYASDERLVAPGPVEVERDGDRLTAGRMEVDWPNNRVFFFDGVRMWRDEGEWLRSPRADYDIDEEVVWVRGPFQAAVPIGSSQAADGPAADDGGTRSPATGSPELESRAEEGQGDVDA